jgi:hypothetical protein
MSEPAAISQDLQDLKRVLQEVPGYAPREREKTLFSVAGVVGRHENPTTKVLQFFLDPHSGHGLEGLFLRTFIGCLSPHLADFDWQQVNVSSQVMTSDGKFIDLLITSTDFVLVIENKIWHGLVNPFDSYATHARRLAGPRMVMLAVLSPHGLSPHGATPPRPWQSVAYQLYCRRLKDALHVQGGPTSKWHFFAQDFLLQLLTELYNTTMPLSKEQTQFAEQHLKVLSEAAKLASRYSEDLCLTLSARLRERFPARPFSFVESPDWGLVCDEDVAGIWLHFFLRTPAHSTSNPRREFGVDVWVKGFTEEQQRRADELFGFLPQDDEGGHWMGERRYESSANAQDTLVTLAERVLAFCGERGDT